MKRNVIGKLVLFFLLSGGAGEAAGQTCTETTTPKVFSSNERQSGISFSPDGTTSLIEEYSSIDPLVNKYTILISKRIKGNWTKAAIAPFSGTYSDSKPSFSPNGRRVFFASTRPVANEKKEDFDLWYVDLDGGSWGKPVHLGSKINSGGNEFAPVVARNMALYFSSSRAGGAGALDLYKSEFIAGEYASPVPLGGPINTPVIENHPYVSAQEDFLIFEASGWKENIGTAAGDLYISCRKNGLWTKPMNLGGMMNSPQSDRGPFYSETDGNLYFVSNRNASKLAIFYVNFKKSAACYCAEI